MYCQDCPIYDPEARRCRDGKVNPQKWSQAVEVSQVLGIRSICQFNDFRERLMDCRKPVDVRDVLGEP